MNNATADFFVIAGGSHDSLLNRLSLIGIQPYSLGWGRTAQWGEEPVIILWDDDSTEEVADLIARAEKQDAVLLVSQRVGHVLYLEKPERTGRYASSEMLGRMIVSDTRPDGDHTEILNHSGGKSLFITFGGVL